MLVVVVEGLDAVDAVDAQGQNIMLLLAALQLLNQSGFCIGADFKIEMKTHSLTIPKVRC